MDASVLASKLRRMQLCGLFDARQVNRFFVWLSPGPDLELVREWLVALNLVKVPWTRYPTLMLGGEPGGASPFASKSGMSPLMAAGDCV